MITEAEKSYDLGSASRRPSRACGVIQPEAEGPRTGEPVFETRRRWMAQLQQGEQIFSCSLPFSSIQVLSGLDDAHLPW